MPGLSASGMCNQGVCVNMQSAQKGRAALSGMFLHNAHMFVTGVKRNRVASSICMARICPKSAAAAPSKIAQRQQVR